MDLSKAFNSINYDLVLAKLHAYGFEETALKLIKSYLKSMYYIKLNEDKCHFIISVRKYEHSWIKINEHMIWEKFEH